jgi:hypothetical protein
MELLFVTTLATTLHSIQPLATTLFADTILLKLFTVHTFLYINSVLGLEAFFGFLNPEDGTDRLSWNFGKKLPLLAAYNPEECSSHQTACLA